MGEPSLTLIRNDSQFGLLLSNGAHEEKAMSRFYLDEVAYLLVSGKHWSYTEFDSVALFQQNGIWLAQDLASRRFFPNPSHRPYHVIFIAPTEFRRLQYYRTEGLAYPIFQAAQQHFGQLPGFSFAANQLETPDDYANRGDAVSPSEYVLPTPHA